MRSRNTAAAAMVHVPKTAADIDDLAKAWKDHVGRAGQCTNMESVSVAQGMHEPPDNHFGRRALRLHGRHDAGALALRYRVRHCASLIVFLFWEQEQKSI